MILAPKIFSLFKNSNNEGLRINLPRIYTLYSSKGELRGFNANEAIKLLRTGKWFDKTIYTQYEIEKNEVLSYVCLQQERIQEADTVSNDGKEPQHKLDHSDNSDSQREECEEHAVRPRRTKTKVR